MTNHCRKSFYRAYQRTTRAFANPSFSVLPLVLLAALLCSFCDAFGQGSSGVEESDSKTLAGSPQYIPNALPLDGIADLTYQNNFATARTITNIVSLSVHEETPFYIPGDFTATVTVTIEYGPVSGPTNQVSRALTVEFKKGEGAKFTARNYLSFQGAEFVKVTVSNVNAPVVGGLDTKKLLVVTNEMRVVRSYVLKDGVVPAFTNPPTANADPSADEATVSWTLPADAGHTHTQLEWTWVDNDLLDVYKVNNAVDDNLLFKNNATRVDLARNRTSYAIPLLYGSGQQGGTLYYRIRAVNISDAGRTDGPWSDHRELGFAGHETQLNWQSTASYAEEGKRKAVVQYFDGSLRSRQTVTKENVTGKTISAETLYDGQGRPAVQILPVPSLNNKIAYTKGLNLFAANGPLNPNGQLPNQDPAELFDLQPANSTSRETPPLNPSSGAANYYSASNTQKDLGTHPNVPDAEGYPYTVTRYTPDATGRILAQSGVGAALKMGSGHETKYYYGSPAQEELDGLFGTEVGNAAHYFKNMVRDANGQMSVSYVDMHGRTIATALAGESPNNLSALNATDYHDQTGSTVVRNLLLDGTNVRKNNAIESINTLLVPAKTTYAFTYALNPRSLQLPSATAPQWCYDCQYDLEISITDESGDTPPIVRNFSNVNLAADDDCATPPQSLNGTNTVSFSEPLEPGSYTVRKTLTLSEASLSRYKDMYLSRVFGGRTEDNEIHRLTDSLKTVFEGLSNCNLPVGATCATCMADLGSAAEFRDKFLQSLGSPALTADLDAQIKAAYDEAKLRCDRLCNNTSQTLAAKRAVMLADMMPYTGQYAQDPAVMDAPGTMFNRYNIFTATNAQGRLLFKAPADKDKNEDFYRTDAGLVDPSIHPDQTRTKLQTLTNDEFAAAFNASWANALLPYHPEYQQLRFAEDNLGQAYNWINDFTNTKTYAEAASKGYIFTSEASITDPFYSASPAPAAAYKSAIGNYIAADYHNGISMWQIAYGDAKCKNIANPLERADCYRGAPKTPLFNNLTVDEKNQVWAVFSGLYAAERETQVNKYILDNRPSNDAQDLVSQGFLVQFPTSYSQMAQQFGGAQAAQQGHSDWSWFPATPGGEPAGTGSASSSMPQVYSSRCNAYINQWTQALLQCPTIQNNPQRDQIIQEITAGMVDVCQRASDESNPYGASNVPTGKRIAGGYNSFEDVVDAVFQAHGIAKTDLCNAFVIEFPKPYGKGPVFTKETISVVDSCHCAQFAKLKTEAYNAERDPTDYTSFNQYLQTTYGEGMSQALFDQMNQHCGQGSAVCRDTLVRYPYNQGDSIACGCTPFSENEQIVYLECRTRVCTTKADSFALLTPQPLPEFLKCGFTGGQRCLDCAQLSQLVSDFKDALPAPYNTPVFSGTDLDATAVDKNIVFAKFVNYRTGFQYSWLQYAKAAAAAQGPCDLAAYQTNNAAHQNVICGDGAPLTDGGGVFVTVDPCEAVHNVALYLAQEIYKKRKEQFSADFEAAYKDRCLTAKNIEQFSVQYVNQEYHYTLYYYDQAGNLVKTVPPKGVRPDFSDVHQLEADKGADPEYYKGRDHELTTDYRYNSLNQVVAQRSPDANTSRFWYDKLGRLVLSQNAQQKIDGKYSYTRYDVLGRITEVGQKTKSQPESVTVDQSLTQNPDALDAWINSAGEVKQQITYTGYDLPYLYDETAHPNGVLSPDYVTQKNLRNRVSYTATKNAATDDLPFSATYYTYDVHGNVDVLLQDYHGIPEMEVDSKGNRFKMIRYDYDLISGKVNTVSYQPNTPTESFYHRYVYDAENRLTDVKTSRDKIYWESDAAYSYYRHGPLARTTLGQLQVQGVDYVYTLQGWLKGVNPGATVYAGGDGTCDAGTAPDDLVVTDRTAYGTPAKYTARNTITFDAEFTSNAADEFETEINGSLGTCVASGGTGSAPIPTDEGYPVARDAYSFSLNYYSNDYRPIGSNAPTFVNVLQPLGAKAAPLYNGNIAAMAVNLAKINKPLVYNYRYDQLNRLVNMEAYPGLSNDGFAAPAAPPEAYKEHITYDPNGNITHYTRNGDAARTAMDEMTYSYNPLNNQLDKVVDLAPDAAASDYDKYRDIKRVQKDGSIGQKDGNYTYDRIGNLIGDASEGITGITWSVYGKILEIIKDGSHISYAYDAAGNRISKSAGGTTTIYVRDASGNVMSVYEKKANDNVITQSEVHLYGSTRIGVFNVQPMAEVTVPLAGNDGDATLGSFVRGQKSYELSNHLGNVLVTVSDKKLGVDGDNNGTVDYYSADVVSAQDYYPFGMLMPGRQYGALGRYGFNGKEQDPETKGTGAQYDYGFRIYDPRLGKFLSVDPLSKSFPYFSPYQFAGNSPISFIDLDGAERYYYIYELDKNTGSPVFKKLITQTREAGIWNGFKNDWLNTYSDGVSLERMATEYNGDLIRECTESYVFRSATGGDQFFNSLAELKKADVNVGYETVAAALHQRVQLAFYGDAALHYYSMPSDFYEGSSGSEYHDPYKENAFGKHVSEDGQALFPRYDGIEVAEFAPKEMTVSGKQEAIGLSSLKGGVLSLAIFMKNDVTGEDLLKPNTIRGGTVFNNMLNRVQASGGVVNTIQGNWNSRSDNLATFNRLVSEGMSPSLAATKTFTGIMAGKSGYTKATVDYSQSKVNDDGTFSKAVVNFNKQ